MDNFIVSARKYRPATFETVVGQKHITSTLQNAISRNQLAHAYLFCGPRGVGKTTCARIFAKAINCQSSESGVCGECESCRSFDEGRSFNIHELDAASNNSVDDIRSLTEQVRIPPQLGKYSVYIIDEVHMLSAQAFNAFLKTLEEPPAHAVFILATTEKHKIIPTILSRCQIFDFNRIRVEDGVEYLKYIAGKENVNCDDESLHLIAQKADGGMRDALSMFDKAVSFCGDTLNFKEVARTLNVLDYDTYFKVTELLNTGDYPSVLTLFDEVLRKGFSEHIFIAGLNSHFRDLLMCKDSQTSSLLEMSGTLLERYRKQSADCETGFLFEAISLLTNLDGTLRTASNPRLNAELALIKLCRPEQKKNSDPITPKQKSDNNPPTALSEKAEKKEKNSDNEGKDQPSAVEEKTLQKSEITVKKEISPEGNNNPEIKKDELVTETDNSPANKYPPADKSASPIKRDATSKANATKTSRPVPTISGPSINELLVKTKNVYEDEASEDTESLAEDLPDSITDAQSEEKIIAAKELFIKKLNSDRPRIAMAFSSMNVRGNEITLTVPTETLREEILRNRSEILELLIGESGITGTVKIHIIVREDQGNRRPIKVEDKLRFLNEQNPALSLLRQKLDMDIE